MVQAVKELMQTVEENIVSTLPATNGDVLRKLAAIYDAIAQTKLPETEWEQPASLRVLEAAKSPRVMQPVPIPRTEEPAERLIVMSSNMSKVVVSPPVLNTKS